MTDPIEPDSKPEQGQRDKYGRWARGSSGNPGGRSGDSSRLRAAIAEHVPAIVQTLTAAALAGDVQAARLLLERCLPSLKAEEQPVTLPDLPTGLTDQGRAILAAAGAGELAPGQAAQLVGAVAQLARVTELDELVARITALEARQ